MEHKNLEQKPANSPIKSDNSPNQGRIYKVSKAIPLNNHQEYEEYNSFIKESVSNREYFKDAINWYVFRYINPINERSLLLIASLVSALIVYCLYSMLSYIFPLIEKKPIFIRSIDEANYHFYLQNLKPHPKSAIDKEKYDPRITNLNEAVAKKLASYYVKEFESYDYRETSFDKVNERFNKIRNLSSKKIYSDFQNMMSSDNPNSPVNFIGKDIQRKIIINSASITKKSSQEVLKKAKNFFLEEEIPNQAEVDFTTITKIVDEEGYRDISENYIAKLKFEFSGTKDTEKFSYKKNKSHQAINDKDREVKFIVTDYQLLKVKK